MKSSDATKWLNHISNLWRICLNQMNGKISMRRLGIWIQLGFSWNMNNGPGTDQIMRIWVNSLYCFDHSRVDNSWKSRDKTKTSYDQQIIESIISCLFEVRTKLTSVSPKATVRNGLFHILVQLILSWFIYIVCQILLVMYEYLIIDLHHFSLIVFSSSSTAYCLNRSLWQ